MITIHLANRFLVEYQTLILSDKERDCFLVLLEKPAKPTKKLKLAMKKYLRTRRTQIDRLTQLLTQHV